MRRAALAALAVAAMAVLGFWRARSPAESIPAPGDDRFPWAGGERITVEVINTTPSRGQARRATFALREAGFDVVRYAGDATNLDSTVVIDRSGKPEAAARVARALGGARVESRPDSLRHLDVSVLLGADWSPPAKPFYP
jgi:hypothetical protein